MKFESLDFLARAQVYLDLSGGARLKFSRFLKKTLRIFLTSLIYLLFFWLLDLLVRLTTKQELPALAAFLTFLMAVYSHEYISFGLVRRFIDKNFYNRLFVVSEALERFNKELNSTLDYQILITVIIGFLKNTFVSEKWAFYLRRDEYYELTAGNLMNVKLPESITVGKKSRLNHLLKNQVGFYPLSKLKQKYRFKEHALNELFNSPHFYYFVPLRSVSEKEGFLFFDDKIGYFLAFRGIKKILIHNLWKMADVIENARLYSEVKRKSLQNRLLLEIGLKISSSLNVNEVLETIIDSVKRLVSYNAAGIFLVDREEKVLRRMVTRGYDTQLLDKIPVKINLGISGKVIRSKKSIIINNVQKESSYYTVRRETHSQLTLPMLIADEVIGIMVLESDMINHFTRSDLELLMTFASQASLAIDNAQLFEGYMQKEQLENQLIVASKVQQALLPGRPPKFPGIQIATLSLSSQIVGGDMFDFFRFNKNELGISIGDVSGKGAPGGILMAALYAGFRSLLKEIYPVVEIVARLNNFMTEATAEGYYATFFFGILDRTSKQFTYTNAGHNPPVLVRKNKTIRFLKTGGIVLGFLGDQEYKQETLQLESGDYVVFYTDGVTEVKNSQGKEFGEDRLVSFIRENYGHTPVELKNDLIKRLRTFSAQPEFEDDVTLIILYVD